jgi:MFS family permease
MAARPPRRAAVACALELAVIAFDRNVRLVYATILLLGTAYGASLSVTPLELEKLHFDKHQIGTLAICFAAGIVTMSIPAGALVRRLSAKATLLGCLLVYAAAVALFPLQTTYAGTAVVRALDGASSVGVWVACETVLLARSDREHKALVMSLYAMAIAVGYVLGSGLARGLVLFAEYKHVFFVASGLALATCALVAARLDASAHRTPTAAAAPAADHDSSGLPAPVLLWRIKTSCFATFSYGYFQASVVLFLPLYLIEAKHVAERDTTIITAFFAGGMLLFSTIAARLGDRLGHLRVMGALASVGIAMILGFVYLTSWTAMCAAIFVAGATLASISPVSLALQGHIADPRDYSRANALYNAFYAAGMLLGPPISSAIMTSRGGPAMLYHFAAMWAVFVVATIAFAADDPARASRRAEDLLEEAEGGADVG